jgi:hypothetical protein
MRGAIGRARDMRYHSRPGDGIDGGSRLITSFPEALHETIIAIWADTEA